MMKADVAARTIIAVWYAVVDDSCNNKTHFVMLCMEAIRVYLATRGNVADCERSKIYKDWARALSALYLISFENPTLLLLLHIRLTVDSVTISLCCMAGAGAVSRYSLRITSADSTPSVPFFTPDNFSSFN